MRPPSRALLCLITFFGLTLLACPALAQSVSLDSQQGFRMRRANERSTDEDPNAISRKDCLDDDPTQDDYDPEDGQGQRTYLQFNISLNNVDNNDELEIWASRSANCRDQDERQGGGNCRRVYRTDSPSGLTWEARVYPRMVIARNDVVDYQAADTFQVGTGTLAYPDVSVCDTAFEDQFIFYVLLKQGDDIVSSATWEDTRIDTAAPPPPDRLTARAGQQNIFLEWDIPTAEEQPDTDGFAFYCVPAGAPTDEPLGAGGASTGNPACPQSTLLAGELPSDEAESVARCGSVRGKGARSGQVGGVDDGTTYAVAIAATDLIQNRGRLSEIQCATPQEVTTFFDRYQEAGGKGGGGLCSTGGRPSGSLLWLLAASAAWALLRRLAKAQRSDR